MDIVSLDEFVNKQSLYMVLLIHVHVLYLVMRDNVVTC